MNRYKIAYWFGTYSGVETVYADDGEEAIAKMWRRLRPHMSLSMAYQSARILECAEDTQD